MTHFTPFFEFALLLVIPGALLVLFAALLLTGRTDGRTAPALPAALDPILHIGSGTDRPALFGACRGTD